MSADISLFEQRLAATVDAFAALIAADPYMIGPPAIPVITERMGDVNNMIQKQLAKLGICVLCVAADGDRMAGKTELSIRMHVRLVAQITELYLINEGPNGTQKPALATCARVMGAVHRKPNGLDMPGQPHRLGINIFELAEDSPFRLVADKQFIVYHVTAFTWVDLSPGS